MEKLTVHIISHSHWDREWYMPLERHKMKLLDLVEDNLEMFSKDERYRCFHMDGQTIALDDYLEICPERKEEILECVRNGKFQIGPWYVLQDEFLTSGEANIRNLMTGCREAGEYGGLCKVGYFPDAFGNVGQMPQILKQAGMEAVAFGRGVKPVGFNNETSTGQYESAYSEMYWQSPDGSALPAILFANWYNNGMEIPVDPEEAKAYWDERLAKAKAFAATGELLFMNGCDHQPVQKDLPEAMETARKLYPDINFVHSTFHEYIRSVMDSAADRLTTIKGELTSQETDGWTTLVNTCSSRIYLKQKNRLAETLLERVCEPLCAMASAYLGEDAPYPRRRIQYAWKTLMQNHPHDSICGCSVDEVNDEMSIRFDRSIQTAESICENAVDLLTSNLAMSQMPDYGENAVPFAVFNTTGWERSGVVTAKLDIAREYTVWLSEAYDHMQALELPDYVVMDGEGNQFACQVKDLGAVFGYELPADRFRQTYMARRVQIAFEAVAVPGASYTAYYLVPRKDVRERDDRASGKDNSLVTGERSMENAWLRVEIAEDGTLTAEDRESGKKYQKLCYLEDTLDAGNEYIYVCPEGNVPIRTVGCKAAEIRLAADEPDFAEFEVLQKMEIPVSADAGLDEEQRRMVEFRQRRTRRSAVKKTFEVRLRYRMERHSRGIEVTVTFDNQMKDHRLRAVMPTGLAANRHFADSVFEVVERPNRHGAAWENPSGCEHQQYAVALQDESAGVAAANFGLYEYEILENENNAIALTLLRSVGEMGDWGVFPTPGAQCLGQGQAAFALYFFDGDFRDSGAYARASQYQVPWTVRQLWKEKKPWEKKEKEGKSAQLPMSQALFAWEGDGICLTGWKNREQEQGRDMILRFFNETGETKSLCFHRPEQFAACYRSNVLEDALEKLLEKEPGIIRVELKPFEIFTMGLAAKDGKE